MDQDSEVHLPLHRTPLDHTTPFHERTGGLHHTMFMFGIRSEITPNHFCIIVAKQHLQLCCLHWCQVSRRCLSGHATSSGSSIRVWCLPKSFRSWVRWVECSRPAYPFARISAAVDALLLRLENSHSAHVFLVTEPSNAVTRPRGPSFGVS